MEQYIRDIAKLENTILELRSELTQTWTRHEKERVRLESDRDFWKAENERNARWCLEFNRTQYERDRWKQDYEKDAELRSLDRRRIADLEQERDRLRCENERQADQIARLQMDLWQQLHRARNGAVMFDFKAKYPSIAAIPCVQDLLTEYQELQWQLDLERVEHEATRVLLSETQSKPSCRAFTTCRRASPIGSGLIGDPAAPGDMP